MHGLKRGAAVKKGSIYGSTVSHNPAHNWVYMPEMAPDEIFLFKQADSRGGPEVRAQHCFHTSFRREGDTSLDRSRRSIAVRLILGFEKEAKSKL